MYLWGTEFDNSLYIHGFRCYCQTHNSLLIKVDWGPRPGRQGGALARAERGPRRRRPGAAERAGAAGACDEAAAEGAGPRWSHAGGQWLPGLLCQLALVVTRSWEVRLHPRQEALVRTLVPYEVVTPARVTELGEVFPQGRHFSRRRRSPEAPEPPPRRTHYRIRAYGQLFQLHLRADAASWPRAKWKCTLAAPRPGGSGARRRPRTCAAASTAAGSTRSGCARPSSASAGD
ncbi:uncharacterized protein [Manis javanica]|uniref:uncharacterized protein n=1 Tax=Manis javanica TaxID=9974 RepID=UPI003C6D8973